MNRLSIILLLITTTQPVGAACLEISEQRFESQGTEFGVMEGENRQSM
jgi:hypothetical protein